MGQESQRLLSNLGLAQFFNDVENKCFAKADALPLSDREGRDRAYFIVHLSRKFRRALEQYIENGQFAESQMNELLEDAKGKKSFLGGLLG